jgi:hypothetical protein
MSRVHLTDLELSRRWRCGPTTLWRLRKTGKLNSFKVGLKWLTSEEEVERIESRDADNGRAR